MGSARGVHAIDLSQSQALHTLPARASKNFEAETAFLQGGDIRRALQLP